MSTEVGRVPPDDRLVHLDDDDLGHGGIGGSLT
jgi:hypothetical protein